MEALERRRTVAADPCDRRRLVYHHANGYDGWDWFWMVPMMLLWIAVFGGVVYAAVRLALKHQQRPPAQQ
jgi:hypothetical protein